MQRFSDIIRLVEQQGTFALAEDLTDILGGHSQAVLKILREETADEEDYLFTEAEWEAIETRLATALVQRALREAGTRPLYLAYPEVGYPLLHRYWQQAVDLPPVRDYVLPFLRTTPQDIYQLLEICSPRVIINHGSPFWASLDADRVNMLAGSLGAELYSVARQVFGTETAHEYPGNECDNKPPTPENRLRQFIYLYEQWAAATLAEEVAE